MGEHGECEQWAPVPGLAGLWASDAGRIATLKDGGRFVHLSQRRNLYGEVVVTLKVGERRNVRLVAGLVLTAFGRPCPGGCRLGHRDGNVANCALKNLLWEQKGQPRAETLIMRKCLGRNCDADFMSWGSGNRLCPSCIDRMGREGDGGLDSPGCGELPDEAMFDVVGNPHK